ncbi:hypothetical protein [Treponema sp. UBA3813]|uniref:hypothetical protein n=1 Tax=Treponema sp. UBA3813 TaxID=1947715 RepID=UPI002600EF71|nr:hypothetical protein [Treponema sp. UBA3813]
MNKRTLILKLKIKLSRFFIISKFARNYYINELKKLIPLNEKTLSNENVSLTDVLDNRIENDFCIALLPASLGDTMLFFMYKDEIEKQNNVRIFTVLRKSHSVIPKLLNEQPENYLLVNSVFDIFNMPEFNIFFGNWKKCCGDIGLISLKPSKKSFFIAHLDYMRNRKAEWATKKINDFLACTRFTFYLNSSTKFSRKLNYSLLPQKKLLKKTVLLAPESATLATTLAIDKTFWNTIAEYYKQKGFNVVYNAVSEINYLSKSCSWLNADLETALGIAIQCETVISIRSGFCDLLYKLGEKLIVIYPNKIFFEMFSLNKMFEVNDIKEFVYNKDSLNEILS